MASTLIPTILHYIQSSRKAKKRAALEAEQGVASEPVLDDLELLNDDGVVPAHQIVTEPGESKHVEGEVGGTDQDPSEPSPRA